LTVQRLQIRVDEIESLFARLRADYEKLQSELAELAAKHVALAQSIPAGLYDYPPLPNISPFPRVLREIGVHPFDDAADSEVARIASELRPDDVDPPEAKPAMEGADAAPDPAHPKRARGA
jgi:hypothetical protein